MVNVCVKRMFSAAHRIGDHPDKCKKLHGHNYVVEVCVSSEKLDSMNMVIDFGVLKAIVDAVLVKYDHKFLNQVLKERNVTAELIALRLWKAIEQELKKWQNSGQVPEGVTLSRIRVYETGNNWVEVP